MAGHLLCWSNPRPAPPSCPCRHPFSADCLEVWLLEIPYGQVVSYGTLPKNAAALEKPHCRLRQWAAQ